GGENEEIGEGGNHPVAEGGEGGHETEGEAVEEGLGQGGEEEREVHAGGRWMRSGPAGPARSDSGPALVLRGARGRDRELLHDLVVAPLLRIVAVDLEHEVQRLLPIALGVELDVAGDAGQL